MTECVDVDFCNSIKDSADISAIESTKVNNNGLNSDRDHNCEMSVDKKFDLMLEEMQNCLKDTADVRTMVHNISDSRSDFFVNMLQSEKMNNVTRTHKINLMDEISRQKLEISYLRRDKQALISHISDLNNQVSTLIENNRKLEQELGIIRMKEKDYYPPSTENNGDYVNINDSIRPDEELSSPLDSDCIPIESTTDWCNSSDHINGNRPSEVCQRVLPASFLQNIGFAVSTNDGTCKSSSWSELRTNRIVHDVPFMPMASIQQRQNSINYNEAATRNRSFSKNESKIYSADNKKRKTFFNNNSAETSPHDFAIDSSTDFSKWTTDRVCSFLQQLGFGAYSDNCQKLLIDGLHLIQATKKEIERELNITNKLHLKKLLIHVRQLTTMPVSAATYFSLPRQHLKIASNFNTRLWLDDIGLLHYTNLFSVNCIDGYMLDQMTLEDLHHLKINNELHCLSLKRGIQLLRMIDYDLSVLIRRPSGDTFNHPSQDGSNENLDKTFNISPGDVLLWTQHQVTEWLRRIELPEYSSNIRGSGIHGAMLILEDRFNANCLATVLNIPHSRSLLRRHLKAKFNELIGPSIVARKRIAIENDNLVQLSTTSKMKFHKKRRIFNGVRRKHLSGQIEELLVPYSINVENIDVESQKESVSRDKEN